MSDIAPALISARLAERAEEFVPALLPAGERVGDEWAVGSVKGEAGKSLKVNITNGRWKDFSSNEPGGDLLDLIAAVRGVSLGAAIKEACEFLGIERTEWSGKRQQKYAVPDMPEGAQGLSKAPAVAAWFASRGISVETMKLYKVLAKGDDVAVFPYLRDGQLVHLKYRATTKKEFWASKGTERCLFGWQALKPMARSVILTEGELDAMTMSQYGFQSMSIPLGGGDAGKQDWIETEWENLERFDTIFLAMDKDKTGQTATQDLVQRLGRHRCKVIELPFKDANECLKQGVTRDDLIAAIRAAKTLDPKELRNAREFTKQVMDRFYPGSKKTLGFLLPWPSLADDFMFEYGATTIMAGFTGHGKSELTGQIILDAMRQDVKVAVASLEFQTPKWMQRLVRQAAASERPAIPHIDKAMEWIGERLWAFDLYGAAKADRILEVFTYAHRRYGVRLFVIDNWSKLGIDDDDLAEQKRVISEITEFSVIHNVHTIVINHLRKTDDDYAVGNKLAVKGSGSITDLADNIGMIWRNRPKETKLHGPEWTAMEPEKQQEILRKPDTVLRFEKVRNGDHEPYIGLFFDRVSHLWVDSQGAGTYVYVKP